MFFSSPGNYLGIDIGEASVKLVELKNTGGIPELVTYGMAEFPVGKINSNPLTPSEIAGAIKEVIKKSGATTKKSYSALPTHEIFISILGLPKLSKKEREQAIYREAAKILPLPLEQMKLEPQILDSPASNKAGFVKVLLVGAPKTVVQKYGDIFAQAKLELIGLETEGFALIRSLVGNDPTPVAVVDFGAVTADITIIDKAVPFLNRSLKLGGNNITSAFVKQLGVDSNEAEQIKRDIGFGDSKNDISSVVSETVTPIVNEIRYTLTLFNERTGKKVEKIILSGGSSVLTGFAEHIEKSLGLRTYIGDPWSRVRYPLELKGILQNSASRFAVAIGLAMRAIKS